MIIVITKCIFLYFVLGLVPTSCVEFVFKRKEFGTPSWRSLCRRSCVDIVKILLCEGGDVEQWLKPRNISQCLRLIHYLLTLSLFLSSSALYCLYHIHAWYWLCGHTCVEPRELIKAPQLLIDESREVVSEPFTGNSGSLLFTLSVFAIKFLNSVSFALY